MPVDHYVRVDFGGFVRLIDALGGVTVDVYRPVSDIFPDPSSPNGEFRIDLPVGLQHMDGRTTLAYCRSRWSTNDFDRSRRQRQVLMALWRQALTPERLAQAPQLWAMLGDAVGTDLPMAEAVRLAHLVSGIEAQDVHVVSLDAAATQPWTTPQGAQVLLPKTDVIRQAILDLLSPVG